MYESTHTPTDHPPNALEVNLEAYRPLLECDDISDADKAELLKALWSIIVSFAQLGWGVHPVQQAQEARQEVCGQIAEAGDHSPIPGGGMVELQHQFLIEQFNNAPDHPAQEG